MPGAGLLLAPGAGASADHAGLVALDRAASSLGFVTRRMDFPYRLAGRRSPDRPEVMVDAVRREAQELAGASGLPLERIYLGGRSMGGRICSMAVAGGLAAAGLVLVSYPLHPPGKPDRLRTAHFPALSVPCLFVSGTRDAFATQDELLTAVEAVPGPVTLRWLEGGDHGLRGREAAAAAAVVDWLSSADVLEAAPGRLGIDADEERH